MRLPPVPTAIIGCALLSGALSSGCATDGGDTADTGGFCADAPVVTWGSFGEGFVREQCQPCHATNAANRYGAPEAVVFDTHELVTQQKAAILRVATGAAPTMPPAIAVEERDKALVEIWLTCWE